MESYDPSYHGPERRIHHVFVTRNTEYHVRAETCVAVRSLRYDQDALLYDHPAVGTRLLGGLLPLANGSIVPNIGELPVPGERVCFDNVLTSRLERIERPAPQIVAEYPSDAELPDPFEALPNY